MVSSVLNFKLLLNNKMMLKRLKYKNKKIYTYNMIIKKKSSVIYGYGDRSIDKLI